jgi:hypothetical protein
LDPTARLRLATRLHFMLRRQLDQDFDIAALVQGGFDARAALRLCRNSGLPELISAARELEMAHRAEAKASARRAAAALEKPSHKPVSRSAKRAAPVGRQAQEMDWSRDTSGFGLSLPPAHGSQIDAAPLPKMGWLERLGLARRNSEA